MPNKKKEEHHPAPFSEEADLSQPLYMKWYRQVVTFFSSADGLTITVGAITFLVLALLLSIDFLTVDKLIENGISKQDVYAPRRIEVIDKSETQQKILQARQNVAPIYRPRAPIDAAVKEAQINLFSALENLSLDEQQRTEEEKRQAFHALVKTPERSESDLFYNRLFKEKRNGDYWSRLKLLTQVTTDHILDKGLSVEAFFEGKQAVIEQSIPSATSRNERELVTFLVGATLQPNRIIDEEAMIQARKKAENDVEPVVRVYQKGEKIVGRGELVTSVGVSALEAMGKRVKGINWLACIGVFLLSGIFVGCVWYYLATYEERQFFKPSYAAMLSTLTVSFLLIIKSFIAAQEMIPFPLLYLFPLGAYALIISIFTHPRTGLLTTLLFTFVMALTFRIPVHIVSVLLAGSMVGIFILSRRINFSDRTQLMLAGFYISVTNFLMLLAVHALGLPPNLDGMLKSLMTDVGFGMLNGFLSAMFTIGILAFLESLFHLVTPYTLMELANHDQPLLRRMQFEAPGTFHHSLMVASLSEAAAEAIGANKLLTRTGCLYHDIGKMKRPLFFIENQAYFGVENPHDKLTPRLSKMVITAHPRDSLEMARQYRLPKVIQKFMTEHHGTLTAGYFYNKACQLEGAENVNKSQFRYPGPKPDIKETAIVMLADATESAVRAMKTPTVSQIEERIDKIFRERIEDGQFDNCPITFRDINRIKETFYRVLRGIQHNRIEYQQTMVQELRKKIPGDASQIPSNVVPVRKPDPPLQNPPRTQPD